MTSKLDYLTRHNYAAVLGSLLLAGTLACTDSAPADPPDVPPDPPQPPTFQANPQAPPITGGSLLVTTTQLAVAADGEHDAIWVADLRDDSMRGAIALTPGAHPGRLIEDADGLVHVVLRDAGSVATLDVDNLRVTAERPVCGAPRGIVFDARREDLHVACASGELVTLPAAGGPVSASVRLAADLRDVVMDGDMRMVTRFASAEVLVVDDSGTIAHHISPKAWESEVFSPNPMTQTQTFLPSVAWRAIPHDTGGMAILHQRASFDEVDPDDGYNGGDNCAPGLVHGTVSVARSDGRISTAAPFPSLLGVDLAIDSAGQRVAVPLAGGLTLGDEQTTHFVILLNKDVILDEDDDDDDDDPDQCDDFLEVRELVGQPIAVAYDGLDRVVVQTQKPHGLAILGDNIDDVTLIDFPVVAAENRARELFHAFGDAFISCATCHPEGRQDNHVWSFAGIGPRRTPSLLGGLLGTEPFHWSGDMADMNMLMEEVFIGRMFHAEVSSDEVDQLAMWMDSLPAIAAPEPTEPAAAERGLALFNDPQVGCANCHAGPLTTDNRTIDVGTGEPLQVPRLVGIFARDNIMHDGCATTLADRFGPCGGGDMHGQTSQLNAQQVADLVAYLQTL